ncbi:MAG: hypothetical protein JXB05_27195 [Myxococcaceae bacterium]|nr:hypothetical protein [Myxococcaceae bacterium]
MPTEVLVMCARCGRPQAARQGNCVACGELLPDAPLPAARPPEGPFLMLTGAGRTVEGVDGRLTYRVITAGLPVVVELGNLQAVALGRRRVLEALVLLPLAAVLIFVTSSVWPLGVVLAGLALITAALWQRYVLVLRTSDGGLIRWPLCTARLGSDRARRLDAAWSSGAQALASRGVAVHDDPGALVPRP